MRKFLCAAMLTALVGCGVQTTTPIAPVSTTPAVFNETGAPTVEFVVPDMTCDGCVGECKEILASQPGVVDTQVDLETKVAKVAVESDKFDQDATLANLQESFSEAKLSEAE